MEGNVVIRPGAVTVVEEGRPDTVWQGYYLERQGFSQTYRLFAYGWRSSCADLRRAFEQRHSECFRRYVPCEFAIKLTRLRLAYYLIDDECFMSCINATEQSLLGDSAHTFVDLDHDLWDQMLGLYEATRLWEDQR